MPKLPQLTGAEVVRRLKRLGFAEDHCKGGHVVLRHSVSGLTTVVPYHGGGKTVKAGTLHGILKQLGVDLKEFLDA
jgi:predicted RNA binding protein YcfA (HicA-like mRNA interferase family)